MARALTVVGGEVRRFGGATTARAARRSWDERHGWLLVLRDREGRGGLGEASPLPGFSPEDEGACERALRGFLELVPLSLELSADPVEWLGAAATIASPAARMAVETALLDLAGQVLGRSVAELLGGRPPAAAVPLAALVDGSDGEELVAAVAAWCATGIATFKVKGGRRRAFEEELGALTALRRSASDVALRLDVNGGWTPREARRNLERLAPLGLEFVEQPVAAEALLDFGPAPVPVAADESVQLPGALSRLVATGSCRVMVLKPMALGGLMHCLELAREASEAGLGVVISHLFDGPVALAAACELALALPVAPLACGLAPHAGLAAWPGVVVPQIHGGFVSPSGRAGLGLEPEAFR